MLSWIESWDWAILYWIQDTLRCGFLDALMPKLTLLGSGGALWLAAAAALIVSKKYRKYGLILLAGLLSGVLVGNLLLKNWIARPRPCWLDTGVQLLIANPADYSFPSGHTLSSTIAAVILTKTNRKFGLAAIPAAALIAFSRLYLFVHFPSDVAGAAILGVLLGLLAFREGLRISGRTEARRRKRKTA